MTAQPNRPTLSTDPSRRRVLCGLAVALVAPGALAAACGDSGGTTTGTGGTGGGAATTSAGAGATSGSGGGATTGALAKLSDVPVGGGLLVESPMQVLLVRTSETEVKGYDPHCTHQRFIVDPPKNGTITCQNHGSQYEASDGAVKKGPATNPLATIDVAIEGDSIVLA